MNALIVVVGSGFKIDQLEELYREGGLDKFLGYTELIMLTIGSVGMELCICQAALFPLFGVKIFCVSHNTGTEQNQARTSL